MDAIQRQELVQAARTVITAYEAGRVPGLDPKIVQGAYRIMDEAGNASEGRSPEKRRMLRAVADAVMSGDPRQVEGVEDTVDECNKLTRQAHSNIEAVAGQMLSLVGGRE